MKVPGREWGSVFSLAKLIIREQSTVIVASEMKINDEIVSPVPYVGRCKNG